MQDIYVNKICEPIPTSLTLKQMARESNTELLNVTWIWRRTAPSAHTTNWKFSLNLCTDQTPRPLLESDGHHRLQAYNMTS
jgi:hypothetical protein